MTKRVVIIGGGITGMTAAYALKQAAERDDLDLSCILVERDNRFGGKIRTHRESGFVMEEGPDSILARKPAGVGLIKELGLESELVNMDSTNAKTFILHQGKLHLIPPGTNMGIPMKMRPFATTKLVSLPGKVRALFDLILPKSDNSHDQALGAFLRRRLGNDVVDHIIEPLLAGIYAGSVDDLSLHATFPQFLELEQKYGGLIRGSIQQRSKAPTITQSHGRSAFVTLRNGLQTIVERLFDELQSWVEMHAETTVTNVRRTPDGQWQVQWVRGEESGEWIADAVLCATQATIAAKMFGHLSRGIAAMTDMPYVSTGAVLLAYPKETFDGNLDGSGFVIPRTEGRAITACTYTSNKWPHTTPEGSVLIRCYVGRAGQQEVLQQSNEDLVETVRTEMRDILNINAKPWFTHVVRWTTAMPQYKVGHVDRVREAEYQLIKDAPGLYVAGAGYHGVGIPDCIQDAREKTQAILAYLQQSSSAHM